MSQVTLVGYHIAPAGKCAQRPQTVPLSSIELPGGIPPPEGYYTLLYGLRETTAELARLLRSEALTGYRMYEVIVRAEVGEIVIGVLSPEKLRTTRFMNLERISTELENEIISLWTGYVRDEMGSNMARSMRKTNGSIGAFVSQTPHLVGRLLQEPGFAHLSVIVYRVRNDFVDIKAGTISDTKAIAEASVTGHDDIRVTF